jgi:hypothetical protein
MLQHDDEMSRMNNLGPISTNPWWHRIIPSALIVLVVFLAYLPALHCGFVWDDDKYVTQNPFAHRTGRIVADLVFTRFTFAIFPTDLHQFFG